jgi:hypothetical protein
VFNLHFFYILPIQDSALVGHLQDQYTIILGSYFDSGSVVYIIFVLRVPPEDGQQGPKHVVAKYKINTLKICC